VCIVTGKVVMSGEWKWAESLVRRDVAMDTQSSDALQVRVAMMERRLRIACVVGMVSLTAVVLLGVTVQNAGSQATRIRAREIQLVDAAGSTRIKMSAENPKQTHFEMSDGSDNNFLLVTVTSQGVSASLYHEPGPGVVTIFTSQSGVQVSAESPKAHFYLTPDQILFSGAGSKGLYASLGVEGGSASASVVGPGANVEVEDNDGYDATLGVTKLKAQSTGTVEKRSAASLVLFDKDKKVLWSAP
jgi:hypothetical protein